MIPLSRFPMSRSIDRREVARTVLSIHRSISVVLGRDLFASPAYEMILDLYANGADCSISLKTLCGASSVPTRTALFTINRLVERGVLLRRPDMEDGRRTNVELTAAGSRLAEDCIDSFASVFGARESPNQ